MNKKIQIKKKIFEIEYNSYYYNININCKLNWNRPEQSIWPSQG